VRVPEIEMPAGQYFSLSGMMTATSGGQTRALLMRNRLLARRCGIEPTLLTFDARPHYPQTRAGLREQGLLVDPMRLLNIFEWHRDIDTDNLAATGDSLPGLDEFATEDDLASDGSVYRTRYLHRSSLEDIAQDFRRPDGSVYLRLPVGPTSRTSVAEVTLVNSAGQPVDSWPGQREWRQQWIMSLAEPEARVFIISDSRFSLAHILPMPDERFHVVHLIHNIHVREPRQWNSPISTSYAPLLQSIGDLDALVTLTRRQQEDIAARYGATNNLYVVPNPVDLPLRPDPMPAREKKRFSIVSRFDRQKRLEEAVRVFALVLKEEPGATLDIYGAGVTRGTVEEEITALGLQDSVILRGHDSRARESLWTATGFLMTSRFEGYPLATLESMSHGCPVISYDIKYGPREQISDGVDGYLLEYGDRQGMADRIVELIRKPELVSKMSEAALDKAAQHDYAAFLADWRVVLEGAIAAKQRRTTLDSVTLKVTRLGHIRPVRLPARLAGLPVVGRLARPHSSSGAWRDPRKLEFAARLNVEGHSATATLDSAVVTLEAVGPVSGLIVVLPMRVQRSGSTFSLSATIDTADVFRQVGDTARSMRLRLRLVWENSSWETKLARPRRMEPNYEMSFSGTGEIALNRGRSAPRDHRR
jgi:poly(glycerol-phosphate) alpha-glucosyltransferase